MRQCCVIAVLLALCFGCASKSTGAPAATAGSAPESTSTSSSPSSTTPGTPVPVDVGGVVPGEINWLAPPVALTRPVEPDGPDDPTSVLQAAALTMLNTPFAARLTLVADQEAVEVARAVDVGEGTGSVENRLMGRFDYHWDSGSSSNWLDRRASLDPVHALLLQLSGHPGAVRSGVQAGRCYYRQASLLASYSAVHCGKVDAEVADGRLVSATAWFPDGREAITIDFDSGLKPAEPLTPSPGGANPCIVTVVISTDIGGWKYLVEEVGRVHREYGSVGDLSPAVPFPGTDLLAEVVDCPEGGVPDGWILDVDTNTAG